MARKDEQANSGRFPEYAINPRVPADLQALYDSYGVMDAIAVYKDIPHTPELVTQLWQTLWKAWGTHAGKEVEVTQPPYTREEIKELESRGRMLIYVPEAFSTPEALTDLQKLLPRQTFCHWAGDKSSYVFKNRLDQHGWLNVESDLHISAERAFTARGAQQTPEGQARTNGFLSGRLVGQTVNTYLVGSLFSDLTRGYLFDEQWAGANSGEIIKSSLLVGSSVRDTDGSVSIPYARTETAHPTAWSPALERSVYSVTIAPFGGVTDPDALRTVELEAPRRIPSTPRR